MLRGVIRLAYCFLTWGVIMTAGYSQEQFVQFTYYDQLTWSENGDQLAFRCILLDESQPERLKVNILIKDLSNDRLICLDPQPERFVISRDKKFLLFSSIYGLYLISLEKPAQPVQIYFRDPASNWYFHDFGFLKNKTSIYVELYDRESDQVAQEYYRIPTLKTTNTSIEWADIKKEDKIRSSAFNLRVDELRGNQLPEVQLKSALIKFLPQADPGNYELVYQSESLKSSPEILLRDIRPRLLSANPTKTEVIVSVFQSNGHQTYRFSVKTKKLISIENKRYFSLSWLDDSRYICATEDGMFLRNIELLTNKKMNQWQLPECCQSIDLSFPQCELQVGFAPKKKAAEYLSENLFKAGYFPRIKYVKDQTKAGYRIRVGGFADKKKAQEAGLELKRKGYDLWIAEISDLYDYFNSLHQEERKPFRNEKEAIVEYKFYNYLRSRIILKTPDHNDKLIVDEMNNIPGRSKW